MMFNLGRALSRTGGGEAEAAGSFAKPPTPAMPAAMNSLGLIFARGAGVARDLGEAARWFRKARTLATPSA